jgi:hypothetical protein
MTAFILFKNNTDCGMNRTIATKTGESVGFNSAEKLFKDRKIPAYFYVILVRDIKHVDQPKVMSNYFGEVPGLGSVPWIFDMPQ